MRAVVAKEAAEGKVVALVGDLESRSINMRGENRSNDDVKDSLITETCSTFSLQENAFLSRLTETGATESSSTENLTNDIGEDRATFCEQTKRLLQNIVAAIDYLWHLKEGLAAAVLKALSKDGSYRRKILIDTEAELKTMRMVLSDLNLRYRSLAGELQRHRNTDAKNKADLKSLKGTNHRCSSLLTNGRKASGSTF